MNNPPTTINYNPSGYEAIYVPRDMTCAVTVRGYKTPDGWIVERGGPTHTEDKPVANFTIPQWEAVPVPLRPAPTPVRETFEDTLLNHRDLVGGIILRHAPDELRKAKDVRMMEQCSGAYKAAEKIREKMTVLGVRKLVFALNPSLFTIIDCFTRDKDGAFWVITCTTENPEAEKNQLILASYILEAGGYVPSNATVRCGTWHIHGNTPHFYETPNDRVLARNLVIEHLTSTPF